MFSRHSILGWGFSALLCALGVAAILAILREIRAIFRLQKIDDLRVSAAGALAQNNLEKAQKRSKLRRFGGGVVNAALTARIGRIAIEVCRPLPFVALQRPMVAVILKNAVSSLFVKRKD